MDSFNTFIERVIRYEPLRTRLFKAVAPSHGRMAVRNRWEDIEMLCPTESPVIVDGGANEGYTVDLFQQCFETAEIHAFEPAPELVESLKSRFSDDQSVRVHNEALGNERGTVSFNIALV